MPRDLHELPKIRDSLSYLYIEKAIIERDNNAIVFIRDEQRIPIPISSITVLLIGPGTSITHAAVKVVCESGCLLIWCGENAMRYYGMGMGETRSSKNLLRQVALFRDPAKHLNVVRKMYAIRFSEIDTKDMSLAQIRGLEGVRVRETYRTMAKIYGVAWHGRNYSRQDWNQSDPLNIALSAANVCLYGLCHAAIVSLGLSPGLGFIHTGKLTSFVYDIADLYKRQITIPAAFEMVAQTDLHDLERAVRIKCRQLLRKHRILQRIAQDIENIFDTDDDEDVNMDSVGGIWDGEEDSLPGGVNYAEEIEDGHPVGG